MQEKGIWKSIKRKWKRLKDAFIKIRGGPRTIQKEDESRCEWYRKLFWKEVIKVNVGKVENSKRIKDGNGRLAKGEDEV